MRSPRTVLAVAALVLALGVSSAVAAGAGKPVPTGKVNLNAATAAQLATLPGIGPKVAARIVEYRQKSGGFKSAQELLNVQGVGEKSFRKLQPYVTTGEAAVRGSSER
ncbi:MAG TPA: helix-hairpin-helix domain-containing protein [Vicinamibacteria bacterium]|jgi:competence protein ComEA